MLSITEVADPRLQRGGVVLVDFFAVGDDGGGAGNRGPLAAAGEEANVDVGVVLEVVRLAGLGVGVEDQVDAVAFLQCTCQMRCLGSGNGGEEMYLCGQSHAAGGQKAVADARGHHAELLLVDECDQVLDLLLQLGRLLVLGGVRVRWLVGRGGLGVAVRHSGGCD